VTDLAVRKPSRRERKAATRQLDHVYISGSSRDAEVLRSLAASAAQINVRTDFQTVRWGGTDWQQEAWLHYDTVPEFHAGVNIGANNVSRARLIGVEVDPATGEPGTQPTDNPVVSDIMGELFGGPSGQGQALSSLYRHLDVAGDCWVLGSANVDLDGASWEILSTAEVTGGGSSRIMIEQLNGMPRPLADDGTELLIRIWQAHPRRRWEPDSPARALLPVLRELAALGAMVSATVKSRIASAGILWIPEEITLPNATEGPNDVTQVRSEAAGAAGWLDLITEAMTAPLQDPDSASAVVPLVATVPAEYIEKINHMSFGADLDAMIEPLREMAIKRLAIGMNLPPSILLGLELANHWTAWAITEDYAKAYLAPKLELIAAALTSFYLRPALRARNIDPSKFAVYFDLDKLVPRQVSTENAAAAWAAGILKAEEYAAILGISTTQMPTPLERLQAITIKLIETGNVDAVAALAPTLAALLGVPVPGMLPVIESVPTGGTAGGARPAGQEDAAIPGSAVLPGEPAQTPPAQTPPPTTPPPQAQGLT
jgi:hypothetical protein